jgi:hypothetical protein
MPSYHISTISLDTFNDVLARYPSAAPENLRDLDTQRYDTIPAAFAHRVASIEENYLLKEEVEKLVEWKLYVLHNDAYLALADFEFVGNTARSARSC